MGNAQSAGHPQNRLVKPRTNSNSPYLAPTRYASTDSPLTLSTHFAQLSTRDRLQIKSQLLSPVETEVNLGDIPDFEKDLDDGPVSVNVTRRNSSRSNSLSCFGSKASSTTKLASLGTSRVSLGLSSPAGEIEAAIQILQEAQKNASPEDVAAIQQAIQPHVLPASPRRTATAEAGLTRRNSLLHRSTSSLTRRRSLTTTPGTATRDSPIQQNRRTWNSWKTPQVDPQEDAKWRPKSKLGLSRLAQAQEVQEDSTPRAQTPADMPHLGTLQLGTLRIANGEPSPDVAAKLNWYAANATASEEDYFMAPHPLDLPLMMKPSKKRRHVRSKSAAQPPTPPLIRNLQVPDDSRRAKTVSRYFALPQQQPPKSGRQHHEEPHYEELEELEPVRRLRVINTSQDTLARVLTDQQSQHEVETDKSILEQPVAVVVPDEGFVSDDAVSVQDEPIDVLLFSKPLVGSPASDVPRTPTRSSSGVKKQYKTDKRPFPKKADSGYSSSGSFRTKYNERRRLAAASKATKPAPETDSRKSEDGSDKGDIQSLYTFEQMLQASAPEQTPSPPSASEHASPQQMHIYSSQEGNTSTLVVSSEAISDDYLNRSALCLPVPKTPRTPLSAISKFSCESKTTTPRKLQKRRPSLPHFPVVQPTKPASEETVPDIPTNVRSQFVRRLSETPGMEFLKRTYESKDHSSSESVDKALPPLPPIQFPSASETPEPRGRNHKRASTERPSSARRGLRRSLSLLRRKPKDEKDEDETPSTQSVQQTVVDLGTTAASLGRSPYDVALETTNYKSASTPTHPHQLGNGTPRARSMTTMDSETAAYLARIRSKDRTLRPVMPQRPKSYYSDREANADLHRRHSFYDPAPPMPTMERMAPMITKMPTIRSIGDLDAVAAEHASPTFERPHPSYRTRTRGRHVSTLISKFDQPPANNGTPYAPQRANERAPNSYQRVAERRPKSSPRGNDRVPQPFNAKANTYIAYHPSYGSRGYSPGTSYVQATRRLHSEARR